MKRKSIFNFLIALFFTLLVVNCDDSKANYYAPDESTTQSEVIECRCTEITSQITQEDGMIKAIPVCKNYFLTESKKLYGLDEQGAKLITVIDADDEPVNLTDFFVKSGDLYFSVQEIDDTDPENPIVNDVYFKQSGETVSSISSLPTKPTLSRSQLDNSEFSIENFDYEGKMCSDTRNKTMGSSVRVFLVNGYSHFPGIGLFINVADGLYNEQHMVREKGLYFWPIDRTAINKVLDSGEMW